MIALRARRSADARYFHDPHFAIAFNSFLIHPENLPHVHQVARVAPTHFKMTTTTVPVALDRSCASRAALLSRFTYCGTQRKVYIPAVSARRGPTLTEVQSWTILIAVITAVIALAGVLSNTAHQYKALKLDHERRKKQATVEAVESAARLIRDERKRVEATLGCVHKARLTEEMVAQIEKNEDLRYRVAKLLGVFEILATGARANVYDIPLLHRLAGTYLRGVHYQFELWVIHVGLGQATVYNEIKELVRDFAKFEPKPHPDSIIEGTGQKRRWYFMWLR